MTGAWRSWLAPAYLLLCLLLGGSAQGIWANLALQLLAVMIIAWAILSRPGGQPTPATHQLWWITGLAIALVGIQLIPLPPAIWSALPGRRFVADGFQLLDIELPWLPISLAPYLTVVTAQALLPPLAMLAAMIRIDAFNERGLALALLSATLAGVALGIMQVTANDPSWYLYRYSAFGAATGFFANSNHMGALLLTCLPFLAALAADRWRQARKAQARALILALGTGVALVLGIGVVVNGSAAVLLLGAPVAAASLIVALRPSPRRLKQGFAAVAALLVVGAVAGGLLVQSGVGRDDSISVASRIDFWSRTFEAAADHMPVGSGLGTFASVYPHYEDRANIERAYVNHAHNDYLELALETGIPGLLILAAFLAWWARRAAGSWWMQERASYARAASVASATLLLHSLVDFPLRTAALSAVMAMCVALLALPPSRRESGELGDMRPARHLTL